VNNDSFKEELYSFRKELSRKDFSASATL